MGEEKRISIIDELNNLFNEIDILKKIIEQKNEEIEFLNDKIRELYTTINNY